MSRVLPSLTLVLGLVCFCVHFRAVACGAAACKLALQGEGPPLRISTGHSVEPMQSSRSPVLRAYRLAIAAQGEYTLARGGTVAAARAAIGSMIERVNAIYQTELGIRLDLVPNNDQLIYIDPATDPYSFNDASETTLRENQATIDRVIGTENYDLGIVFNTGEFGLARLRSVCVHGFKAMAAVALDNPEGSHFDVWLLAHELAHLFGANHTFNTEMGICAGYRHGSTAYEPGSGSTLMSYAGIRCGEDSLQAVSDHYFHSKSIEEIQDYVTRDLGSACPALILITNNSPSVSAGRDYVIPKGTPFTLTASGSDLDGDTLSYGWEEVDLGPAQSLSSLDNGKSPLFRSFLPSASPARTFPNWADLLSGASPPGEKLPAAARTMRFRVTVRDGHIGTGALAWDEMSVIVDGASGPFRVDSPEASAVLSNKLTVKWDVAGTDLAPINATHVNILLSTNNGNTFPVTLAANTSNDGEETFVLESMVTPRARIKIEAANNIFFAISPEFGIHCAGEAMPVIASVAVAHKVLVLSWRSINGRSYRAQHTVDVKHGWRDVDKAMVATSTVTAATLDLPDEAQGFFRIRLLAQGTFE